MFDTFELTADTEEAEHGGGNAGFNVEPSAG